VKFHATRGGVDQLWSLRDSSPALALCLAVGSDGLRQDDGLPARIPGHGGCLGHRAAAIDVDQRYFNVDAPFELPYDDARNAMVLSQAGQRPSRSSSSLHARKRHPGWALLDNSDMTPEQPLAELARLVSTGTGRLSRPL